MLELAILKNFDSVAYKAGVQLAGSLTTYLDNISVSVSIPSSAMVVGNFVLVAIPGGNLKDACILAAWPGGAPPISGMLAHGNEYHVPDFEQEGVAAGLVTAHAALTTGVHGAITGEDLLVAAISRSNFVMIPTNAGWTTSLVGSGVFSQQPSRINATTGITAYSRALGWMTFYGFNEGHYYSRISWDKKLVIIFGIGRYTSDTECIARLQFKSVGSEGPLADKGLGIKLLNYALWGESYGTSLGEVDLSTTLTNLYDYQLKIVFTPATSIEWYINGVLKGTQSDTSNIPSGTKDCYIIITIKNGATGGVDAMWSLMQGKMWQAR